MCSISLGTNLLVSTTAYVQPFSAADRCHAAAPHRQVRKTLALTGDDNGNN